MEKNIHQIWLGSRPIPPQFLPYMESWKRFFPDWNYRLWTDKDLWSLSPLLMTDIPLKESFGFGIRSDVLRLELLRLYGGIYADCDFEAFRNFEEILRPKCFHYGDELPVRPSNAWMAAPACHGFPKYMIEHVGRYFGKDDVTNISPKNAVTLTGPESLHRALQSWVWVWNCNETIVDQQNRDVGGRFGDVVVFRQRVLYPYWWTEKDSWNSTVQEGLVKDIYPTSVAAHHWGGTWK